jgi:hypothetical protein
MDSRFELFPPDIWRGYDAITGGGPAAQEALDRWAVDRLVIAAGGAAPPGWVDAYRDADGAVLVRATP